MMILELKTKKNEMRERDNEIPVPPRTLICAPSLICILAVTFAFLMCFIQFLPIFVRIFVLY